MLLLLVGCGGGGYSGPRTEVGGVGKVTTNSYFCRGEWHYPQKFYEYDETGIASWYGPGFHGKPKPLGEAFDMHGISAAHRTLPLPTVVKVTNLQSGKSIKLVVDDRGPFVYKGRIIDLSIGAAKMLGTYSKGLVTVRVQSIPGESRALSDYLARHGNKKGKMKDGRTWQQVYTDEIAGKYNDREAIGHDSIVKSVKEPVRTSKTLGELPLTLDDVLDKVAPAEAAVTKNKDVMKPVVTLSDYINLGVSYLQKANAQKVATSLPKAWNAAVQSTAHPSGQTFYSIKIGPLNSQSSAQILQQCQKSGYAQAIMLKD